MPTALILLLPLAAIVAYVYSQRAAASSDTAAGADDYSAIDALIPGTPTDYLTGLLANIGTTMSTAARGIFNNNPGNIVQSAIPWQGKVSGTDSRFETFATAEDGIRALALNLRNYQRRQGLNTVRGIITRWSETDQAPYIAYVAAQLGVTADQPIDTGNPATLAALTAAIIAFENGGNPYSAEQLAAGVGAALNS